MKRLYKSKNKMLDGVCAGVAEYFDVDPTLVRIGFVATTVFTGLIPGVILYIAMAIIMPRNDQ